MHYVGLEMSAEVYCVHRGRDVINQLIMLVLGVMDEEVCLASGGRC